MSLYTYVDTPNANLVCCICHTPFTDPTTTVTCTHTFCRECILRALSHAPLCPVDRSPLSEEDLGPANPIVRSLVAELEVECVHSASGCKHTCQRQLLTTHLRDECMYSQVGCDEAECGMIVARGQLNAHRKEKHGLHEEGESDKNEGPRMDTNSEPVESTAKLKALENSSSSATQFDNQRQKTIDLLTEQNMLLKYRVEMLEGTVQAMKKEMGAVRSALGPWFRIPSSLNTTGMHYQTQMSHSTRPRAPMQTEEVLLSPVGGLVGAGAISHDTEDGNNGATMSSYEAASSSSATGGGGPSANNTNTATSGGHAHQQGATRVSQAAHVVQGSGHGSSLSLLGEVVGNNGDGIGRADPLAEYFPTLGDFEMGGLVPQQQTQFGPHGAFMQQQQQQPNMASVGSSGIGVGGGPGGLQISPQAVTRVAPLDLGTNLVGTLEGLRESVVGVAAGIDSLGRRSEIALANESLRLGEEVVSMRAAVHGLRMQIHAMMMERNAQVTGREEGMGIGSSWMAGGGFNFGAQGANAASPPVPPRMYSYGGPPNITKL